MPRTRKAKAKAATDQTLPASLEQQPPQQPLLDQVFFKVMPETVVSRVIAELDENTRLQLFRTSTETRNLVLGQHRHTVLKLGEDREPGPTEHSTKKLAALLNVQMKQGKPNKQLPSIKHLTLGGNGSQVGIVHRIMSAFPYLQSLTLDSTGYGKPTMTLVPLPATLVPHTCPHLQRLVLGAGCELANNAEVQNMLQHTLTHLHLSHCTLHLLSKVPAFSQLEHLSCTGMSFRHPQQFFSQPPAELSASGMAQVLSTMNICGGVHLKCNPNFGFPPALSRAHHQLAALPAILPHCRMPHHLQLKDCSMS